MVTKNNDTVVATFPPINYSAFSTSPPLLDHVGQEHVGDRLTAVMLGGGGLTASQLLSLHLETVALIPVSGSSWQRARVHVALTQR